MSRLKTNNQHGFTILELMIATMVFSVIFLATTTALLQIGKLYYKGVISGRTQETARGIMDQMSQQLQFGTDVPVQAADLVKVVPGGPEAGGKVTFRAICIGNTRYAYRLNTQVTNDVATNNEYDAAHSRMRHALWRDTVVTGADCTAIDISADRPTAGGEEMLDENMRLTQLEASCDNNNMCTIAVGVLYGDDEMLTPAPAKDQTTPAQIKTLKCATIIGNHWCAGSQLNTSVFKRVGGN